MKSTNRIQIPRRALWRQLPENVRVAIEIEADMAFFCYNVRLWLIPSLVAACAGLVFLWQWAVKSDSQYIALISLIGALVCFFTDLILAGGLRKASKIFRYRLDTVEGLAEYSEASRYLSSNLVNAR